MAYPNQALQPPPSKRRDSRSAGCTGGPVNIQTVSFPWDTGEESIFKFDIRKVWKVLLLWMMGFEPTTQKTHGLS